MSTVVHSNNISYYRIIGASLSEPHTNRYYEKIAIVMYVCVCVRDTSSTCCTRARTRECTCTCG